MSPNSDQTINKIQLEDLQDFNNLDIRKLLTESELVQEADVISEADYEAVKLRSEVLLSRSTEPLSVEAALLAAYVDRMQITESIGLEALKDLPNKTLRAMFYVETKVVFTEEELDLFKSSPLSVADWTSQRINLK